MSFAWLNYEMVEALISPRVFVLSTMLAYSMRQITRQGFAAEPTSNQSNTSACDLTLKHLKKLFGRPLTTLSRPQINKSAFWFWSNNIGWSKTISTWKKLIYSKIQLIMSWRFWWFNSLEEEGIISYFPSWRSDFLLECMSCNISVGSVFY